VNELILEQYYALYQNYIIQQQNEKIHHENEENNE